MITIELIGAWLLATAMCAAYEFSKCWLEKNVTWKMATTETLCTSIAIGAAFVLYEVFSQ